MNCEIDHWLTKFAACYHLLLSLYFSNVLTDMSSKRTRKDLTPKLKPEIIKCVEGGAKHSAVAIANSVSRSTVTKVIQNKKKLMDAFMVC